MFDWVLNSSLLRYYFSGFFVIPWILLDMREKHSQKLLLGYSFLYFPWFIVFRKANWKRLCNEWLLVWLILLPGMFSICKVGTVLRYLFSQKSSMVDVLLGSKQASDFSPKNLSKVNKTLTRAVALLPPYL